IAVDPIVADVGRGPGRELQLATWDGLGHDRGQLADPEVLGGRPDVEGPIVDAIAGRFEREAEGLGDVLDVDDRPPRAAVALEMDPTGRDGPRDEVVEDDVEPLPGGHAVRRRASEVRRRATDV